MRKLHRCSVGMPLYGCPYPFSRKLKPLLTPQCLLTYPQGVRESILKKKQKNKKEREGFTDVLRDTK